MDDIVQDYLDWRESLKTKQGINVREEIQKYMNALTDEDRKKIADYEIEQQKNG
jgi:hypothetical protein